MLRRNHALTVLGSILSGIFLSFFLTLDFTGAMALESGEQIPLTEGLLACFHSFSTAAMVLPFLIGGLIYFARKKKADVLSKRNSGLALVSLVFGLLNSFGQQMYHNDHLFCSFPGLLLAGAYALSCAAVFYCASILLFSVLPLMTTEQKAPAHFPSSKKQFFLFFAVILLGWLPWMIAYYPFSADWDVYDPIQQYLGLTEKTSAFPWFYCCTVGFFYQLGLTFGDKNMGIFLYVLLRAFAMAAIYAALAVKLRRRGVRPAVVWGIVLFYAFVPVWGAYAKHGFKDTISCALFCWYVMETVEVTECIKNGNAAWKPLVSYALSSLLISLHRNNCIYIAVPVTLLLILAVIRSARLQKKKLRVCALLLSGTLVFFVYSVCIQAVGHVRPGSPIDALSVPLQQTARTVRDHGAEITQEERAAIDSVLPFDEIGKRYDPLISDPVKGVSRFREGDPMGYLRAYLSMGIRFPLSYAEAALGQSYGYYAFTGDQALHAGNWNCGMTIFDWVKDPRFDDAFTCDYVDALSGLRVFLDDWAKLWHQIPLLNLSDMKAVYTWLIVLAGVLLLQKKRKLGLIPVCACLITVLFCCASPVNDCFRYYAPVAAASPALLMLFAPLSDEL